MTLPPVPGALLGVGDIHPPVGGLFPGDSLAPHLTATRAGGRGIRLIVYILIRVFIPVKEKADIDV